MNHYLKKISITLYEYAKTYLTAESPLTSGFYGCLTDGKFWQFVKIPSLIINVQLGSLSPDKFFAPTSKFYKKFFDL
jgi:hypothetical protein